MKFIKWLPFPVGWKAMIACFFQSKFTVSSVAVIFNKKREVLLFYHTYRKNPWGLPGGFVNSKEHPEEAIKREVMEEAGLKISQLIQLPILLDKDLKRLVICYLAKKCTGIFKPSKEASGVTYFPLNKMPKLPARQEKIIKKAYLLLTGSRL